MSDVELPLILVPGMGANQDIYAAQILAIPNLSVIDWLQPEDSEDLASYAQRLAERYDPGKPCLVGGASFGGIVAQEMAKHIPAKACILIGSIKDPSEAPWWFHSLRPLSGQTNLMPLKLLQASAGTSCEFPGLNSNKEISSVLRQFSRSDRELMQWSMQEILRWQGLSTHIETYRIHGDLDPIFPIGKILADYVVEKGRHVISASHPEEVTNFLKSILTKTSLAQEA